MNYLQNLYKLVMTLPLHTTTKNRGISKYKILEDIRQYNNKYRITVLVVRIDLIETYN